MTPHRRNTHTRTHSRSLPHSHPAKTNRKLKIIHANVDSLLQRQSELELLTNETQPDIVALNETKTDAHDPIELPNYTLACRHDISRRQGGIAILVKRRLKYSIVPTNQWTRNNKQVLAISIKINNMTAAVVAYYNAPNDHPNPDIFDTILSSYKHAIFIGDFNSKHLSFGCSCTNTSGDILFNITENHDLTVLNSPTPTFYRGSYSQLLDIALATPKLANLSHPVKVGPDIGTNHQPITLEIDTTSKIHAMESPGKNYNKTNWTEFRAILQENTPDHTLDENISKDTIDSLTEQISNIIYSAIEKSTPSYNKNQKHNPLPRNIVDKIKLKRKLRRLLQKRWNPELNNRINRLHREIKADIKANNIYQWDNLASSLNDKIDPKSFWSTFKKLSNFKSKKPLPPSVYDPNNTLTQTEKETSNVFAASLSNIHKTHEGPEFDDNFRQGVDTSVLREPALYTPNFDITSDDIPIIDITKEETTKTISKIKKLNTAPGDDKITYKALKNLPNETLNLLVKLFNIILKTGYYPDIWKHATGVMIPKPNKDPKIALNYRPISLLRCLGKILEKILAERMLKFMNNNKLINKWQRAYLAKKEANEHVYRLGTQLKHFRQLKWQTGILLFDVEKAFDSVWHNGIRYKLKSYNLPKYMIRILSSFITDRTISVKINDEKSNPVQLKAGTPQGSVISPLLFILYVNDIPIHPNNKLEVSQYADDLALWTSAKSLDFVKARLQRGIDDLELWCSIWRIKLNSKKTQYLITNEKASKIDIAVNNMKINPDKTANLLGITFDKQLSLSAHIDIIRNKSTKRLNLLRSLKGTNFGANGPVIMKTYKTYVRPVLETGYVLTADASDHQLNKLQVIQNHAIRLAYNLPRSTNIKTLHEISGLEPIRDRLHHLKTKALNRFCQHSLLVETRKLLEANPLK